MIFCLTDLTSANILSQLHYKMIRVFLPSFWNFKSHCPALFLCTKTFFLNNSICHVSQLTEKRENISARGEAEKFANRWRMVKTSTSKQLTFSPNHIDVDFNWYSLIWGSFWMYSNVDNVDKLTLMGFDFDGLLTLRKKQKQEKMCLLYFSFFQIQNSCFFTLEYTQRPV